MVEVSLTVGKLDASLALLLTKDHHLIEFPTILLPNGVRAGSIVKIKCDQDLETEKEEAKQFSQIQDEILNTFGKNLPKNPVLKVKNVTQTSCVLEWEDLDLGTASLKNLFLFKDGKKLGTIPQPLTNKTTKLSGLPIDKTFEFQLRLDTTAGIYNSDILEVTTHKMTDLSGITVCLGDINANEQFTVDDIQQALKDMGANYPAQTKISVDTTHFICTRENKLNPEYIRASELNIPIIRPEWLKACQRDRRIVGVRDYYVKDCVLPDIFAKNFWNKAPAHSQEQLQPSEPEQAPEPQAEAQVESKAPEESKDLPPPPKDEVSEGTGDDSKEPEPIHEIKLENSTTGAEPETTQTHIEITETQINGEELKIDDKGTSGTEDKAIAEEAKAEEAKAEEPKAEEKQHEPSDKAENPQVKAETPEAEGTNDEADGEADKVAAGNGGGKKKKNNKKKNKKKN